MSIHVSICGIYGHYMRVIEWSVYKTEYGVTKQINIK